MAKKGRSKRRKTTSRVYWRERGGESRAYGDFRDFADVGGGREALIAEGATSATTDPLIAEKLVADRLSELQERRRNKTLLGVERQEDLQDYVSHHLVQKKRAGEVGDTHLDATAQRLAAAVDFFGASRDVASIGVRDVQAWWNHLRQQPRYEPKRCPECGSRELDVRGLVVTCSGSDERDAYTERWNRHRGRKPTLTHASDGQGKTACGGRVGQTTEEGGSWERTESAATTTCANCRRVMEDRPCGATSEVEPYSKGTIRHYLNALSNLYRRAASEGLVRPGYNPVAALLEKPTPAVHEADWLEIHEAALFLEAARTYTPPPEQDAAIPFPYALIATFLLTGGRKSEVLGLTVADVSFERATVTFRPNRWRPRLKTRTSHRTIPLWPQLAEILGPHIYGTAKAEDALLFPSPTGPGMIRDTRKLLDAIARRAGFEQGSIRTKRFRHTYATARLQTLDRGAPVSVWTVSRELGHSSTNLVEQRYGHLGDVRHRSEVVEYRVEAHEEELGERLVALRAGGGA